MVHQLASGSDDGSAGSASVVRDWLRSGGAGFDRIQGRWMDGWPGVRWFVDGRAYVLSRVLAFDLAARWENQVLMQNDEWWRASRGVVSGGLVA